MKKSIWICLFFIFLALIQISLYYPKLTEIVASHFGGDGNPNGWSTKDSFCFFYIMLIVILPLIFIVGIPFLISKMPNSMINCPNKDYYLAPERKEETITYLNNQLTIMGYAIMVFLIVTMELMFEANLKPAPYLSFLFFLFVFIILDLIWTIKLLVHFSKKGKVLPIKLTE